MLNEYFKLTLNTAVGIAGVCAQIANIIQTYVAVAVGLLTMVYLVYQIIKINIEIKQKRKNQ